MADKRTLAIEWSRVVAKFGAQSIVNQFMAFVLCIPVD